MSSMVFRFEDPFRPIYEFHAISAWAAACICTIGLEVASGMASPVLTGFASVCVLFAAWRAWSAARLWTLQMYLKGVPLSFTTRQEVVARAAHKPNSIYLGMGFDWNQSHAQFAHHLRRIDPHQLQVSADDHGRTWIHGCGMMLEQPIYLPLDHTAGHMLLVGTTRAGKTRFLDSIIVQAVARGEPVIAFDPKGDRGLRDSLQRALEDAGRPNDFIYFHPAFPENSWRIDPLKNFNRATELASRIAALIAPESGNDPFSSHSMMVMNNLCEGMLMISMKPTLKLLKRFVDNGPEWLVVRACEAHFEKHIPDWRELVKPFLKSIKNDLEVAHGYRNFYINTVQRIAPHAGLAGLLADFMHDKQHQQKMIASLTPVLTMLTAGSIGDLLSPDPNDLDDRRGITDFARIIRNAQGCYMGLDSLSDSMVGNALGTMFTSDLTAVAGDRYNYDDESETKYVNIIIDEAAELISDKLIQLLNKAGGAKFRLIIATQTFADFAARVGSDAKARMVLGNLNCRIILRSIDGETQEYIAEQFPKTFVRHIEYSQATDASTDNPLSFGYRVQESMKETEVPLVEADVLGFLPNLEFFAQVSAGRVLKGRIPIIRDQPEPEKTKQAA